MSSTSRDRASDSSNGAASAGSASRAARDILETTFGPPAGAQAVATAVIADDHPLFVEAMRIALSCYGIEAIGSTGRGDEVVPLVEELAPDLVLLDLGMPGMSGLECLPLLGERCPETKVIVVSADDREETVDLALRSGASCFIAKSVKSDDLARAILLVSDNSPVVISRIRTPTLEQAAVVTAASLDCRPELTKREHEILALVAEGRTNSEVARTLWVTEQTVKFHLSNIFRKLDVANRTQAAAKARQLGLGELETTA